MVFGLPPVPATPPPYPRQLRLLVAGGRTYSNVMHVHFVLNLLRPSVVIEGGARGADRLAREWADLTKTPFEEYAVDHALDGPWPGAGPRRNRRMLDNSNPDMGLLFPGGRGTDNMRTLLAHRGVPYLVSER